MSCYLYNNIVSQFVPQKGTDDITMVPIKLRHGFPGQKVKFLLTHTHFEVIHKINISQGVSV